MKIRKFLGIAVSAVMTLSMAIPISAAEAIYPYDVQIMQDESDENRRTITKYYELNLAQTPSDISTEPFEQDGFFYALTDIVQNNVADVATKTGRKTVTIETESDKMDDILKVLPLTYEFSNKNGFEGEIPLDLSSIEVESKGTGYSSYTVTATREYPNLSSNDTSLIPKSTTEKGVNCSLDDVEWRSLRLDDIDADEVVTSYTAVAKYSGTASYSYSKGFTVTAQYKGDVHKTDTGKTVCEARFSGVKIVPDEPEVEIVAEHEEDSSDIVLPVLVSVGAIVLCGIVLVIVMLFKQNRKLKKQIQQVEYDDFREVENKYDE